MSDFAATADVEAAWRPLTTAQEVANAEFFLEYASAIIRAEIPTVDDRITAGTLSAVLVKGVCVAMVLRALKNPEGYRSVQQSIEDYSETRTRDSALSAGGVYLSEDECYLLTGKGQGAFSIRPAPSVTTYEILEQVARNRAIRDGLCDPIELCP